MVKLVKGNRKSTKIVEYQLICIDYRWICIIYQALVLETFFCLSKRWLFLICDIILDYREALVFYRIFSTLVINFFEFLKFGSKSIEKSIDNVYQSTSVTVNFTDNRDYRTVLYSMGGASGLGIRGGGLRWRLVIPAGRGSSPWDLLPELSTPAKPGLTQQGLNLLRG